MRRIAIILLVLQLIGCCTLTKEFGVLREYVATALHGELVEDNGWVLHTPPKGWMSRWTMELLPEYFNGRFPVDPFDTPNHFGAVYSLVTNQQLALTVGSDTFFYLSKKTRGGGDCIKEWEGSKATRCRTYKDQVINISINNVNVTFDNTSVFFIVNGKKIRGQEMVTRFYKTSDRLTQATYNISLIDAPNTMSEGTKLLNSHIRFKDYSTFYFLFEDMTCTDLENAIFVVDGLYHQGKQLPPLKVRLNYLDFSQVPEYTGEKASGE